MIRRFLSRLTTAWRRLFSGPSGAEMQAPAAEASESVSGPAAGDESLGPHLVLAAERILGNESLRSHLDDQAAQELLNWGMDMARQLVTGANQDQSQGAPLLERRLEAVLDLLRTVNRWLGGRLGEPATAGPEVMNRIWQQAALIYDEAPRLAAVPDHEALLRQLAALESNSEKILRLRELLEPPAKNSAGFG